jgi:hypothetical protein
MMDDDAAEGDAGKARDGFQFEFTANSIMQAKIDEITKPKPLDPSIPRCMLWSPANNRLPKTSWINLKERD